METLIERNKSFAAHNIEEAHSALMKMVQSQIGAEIAHAAASGENSVTIHADRVVTCDSRMTWQAPGEDAVEEIACADDSIGGIITRSYQSIIQWLFDSVGISALKIMSGFSMIPKLCITTGQCNDEISHAIKDDRILDNDDTGADDDVTMIFSWE